MPLRQPPLDDNGAVLPHDHNEILAEDQLIRRISEKQLVWDADGQRIVSSIAFKPADKNAGMSIDLERQIIEAGLVPRDYVTTPRWIGSVVFKAGDLRNEGLRIGFHPLPDNPYHGEVWGLTSSHARRLKGLATWYVSIPSVKL